ncbi:BTAD domain-containing putative transcriptional regulator [Actinomadura sp. 7K507]|uniref:AfsR/SARP family transcriptional regulator n=1 Tax=Actinomadura sp. 7K507 TaxID=2530365 RepID=UPI001404820F|nr:BTAD domain-containing putative transcriptional regulator [Actinomadura sp. 7K507]
MTIAASRQQITLALLLLEAGHVVSVERIMDALWDGDPPRTAKSQVQITISALRRLLGESVIVTRPPGYLIKTPAEAIDLVRFEELTTRASRAAGEQRFAEAVGDFREALALWRGPALEGLQREAIQSAATRLNEWRISTYQDCLEHELRLGRHHELIGELTELVAEHPLNEHLRGQLILALYRAGRQADALETFRIGRSVLRDELGIDPCAELCRLEQAILSRDAQIDLPAPQPSAGLAGPAAVTPVPRQLPRTIADFGGREEVLGEVLDAVTGNCASDDPPDVPVVVLTGRGGVGKTALAVRAAHLLSSDFPDGQLFLQLRPRVPDGSASLVEQLLRSLRLHSDTIPPDLEGRIAMYRSVLAGLRVLVVIDGAFYRDDITPFLPGTHGCAAIVTCGQHISHLEGVHQIQVGPLDEPTANDLLMTLIGDRRMNAEPEAARELFRLCEGIPMALRIVSAKLRARPHWPISHMVGQLRDETRRLDELSFEGASVRATIAMAYDLLDEAAQRLLRRLSLVGTTDFAFWVGVPLLDTDIAYAEYLFQQLVSVHLVEPTVTGDGVVRFRLHDLVRIYAAERCSADESTADRLDAMRRLVSCWLFIATTARRRIYGSDFAILHGTAEHWPLPEHGMVLQDPAEWFRMERNSLVTAILQAAQIGNDELCWDLAGTAVTAFEFSLSGDDWHDSYSCALSVVRRTGNRRGEAMLLYSLGTLETGVHIAPASGCFERSLTIFTEIGDQRGRSLALRGLALVDALSGDYDTALARYRQALTISREIEDLAGEAYTLTSMAQISADRREFVAAGRLLDEAFLIANEFGTSWLKTQVEYALAELQLRRGLAALAADTLSSVLRFNRETGDVIGQVNTLTSLGNAICMLGDFACAESAFSGAYDLAGPTGNRLCQGRALLGFAELHFAKDEAQPALARVEEAIAVFREHGTKGVWYARALELFGRIHDRAGRSCEAVDAWEAAAELARGTDAVLAGQITRSLAQALPHSRNGTSQVGALAPEQDLGRPGRSLRG